jgi:dihydrofolate reductase
MITRVAVSWVRIETVVAPAAVAELKRRSGVDEIRLVVAPVIVGTGRRLFPDGGATTGLRLVRHDTTPSGLGAYMYQTTGPVEYGTYAA